MSPGPPQELKRLSLREQRGLEEAMTGSILKGTWDSAGMKGAYRRWFGGGDLEILQTWHGWIKGTKRDRQETRLRSRQGPNEGRFCMGHKRLGHLVWM